MTEFNAIAERAWARRRDEDQRAGIIAAVFASAHRAKGAKAAQPDDFFPSLKEKLPDGIRRGQTPEQMLAVFQVITGAEVIQ